MIREEEVSYSSIYTVLDKKENRWMGLGKEEEEGLCILIHTLRMEVGKEEEKKE